VSDAVAMLIVRQVVGAAVVSDLLFGDQMVLLITLALKRRAVALCAWVVVAHAHRIVPRVKSTVRFVNVRRPVLVIHQCVHFSLTVKALPIEPQTPVRWSDQCSQRYFFHANFLGMDFLVVEM
jgi:hypothetical protein